MRVFNLNYIFGCEKYLSLNIYLAEIQLIYYNYSDDVSSVKVHINSWIIKIHREYFQMFVSWQFFKGNLYELDTFGWMAFEEFIGKIDKNAFSEGKEKQKAKFGV